jgi:hypothetical protein
MQCSPLAPLKAVERPGDKAAPGGGGDKPERLFSHKAGVRLPGMDLHIDTGAAPQPTPNERIHVAISQTTFEAIPASGSERPPIQGPGAFSPAPSKRNSSFANMPGPALSPLGGAGFETLRMRRQVRTSYGPLRVLGRGGLLTRRPWCGVMWLQRVRLRGVIAHPVPLETMTKLNHILGEVGETGELLRSISVQTHRSRRHMSDTDSKAVTGMQTTRPRTPGLSRS